MRHPDPVDAHLQLAIYDLIGALFAPSDPVAPSPSCRQKLFKRICRHHQGSCHQSGFPVLSEAAIEATDLRHATFRKLFTARELHPAVISAYDRPVCGSRRTSPARRAPLNTGLKHPAARSLYAKRLCWTTRPLAGNFAARFQVISPGAHWNNHADARDATDARLWARVANSDLWAQRDTCDRRDRHERASTAR